MPRTSRTFRLPHNLAYVSKWSLKGTETKYLISFLEYRISSTKASETAIICWKTTKYILEQIKTIQKFHQEDTSEPLLEGLEVNSLAKVVQWEYGVLV